MSLFQASVLQKYIKEQDNQPVIDAYQKYKSYFFNSVIQQNIRDSKEEQFQEGFLRELFVNIFGYTINPNPNYNLTTEFKNETGPKKADGAILSSPIGEVPEGRRGQGGKEGIKAIGVIELKSTKTKDLESIRQQAFDYKANQSECVYVITSNFEKLRFYINNAVEYEEFDLFNITPERFELLYLCLSEKNILNNLPLKIKEASIQREEVITKKIYADYTLFKRNLYHDLIAKNLNLPVFLGKEETEIKLLLFKKSQKLLDRFLFIFFAEDKGLLPPNSIPEIIHQWEQLKELDAYSPLYDRYKKYFNYLNVGWKGQKYEIFGYNGGLFVPDEILDTITIDDELLKRHTNILSEYDFNTDVDVNILGHIFENSLNEIEEVTAELEGQNVDLKKSKRKKDGVYYTPKYITKYIVDNTVGKLCQEKKEEIGIVEEEYFKGRKGRHKTTIKELDTNLLQYRDWLLQITICDPACGSGAFLNQALDFLIREHHYIDELHAKLFEDPIVFQDIENTILENNLYGVDINEESVEIAKLSLWLRTAQKGRKLTTLSNNIKCGNSLIDDPEVAGDKAFNWQKEFPNVFKPGAAPAEASAKSGFDVVIGNPPYVRVQFLPYHEIDFYKQTKKTAYKRIDISTLFFEEGYNLLKENGKLSFITSNQFQTTEYGLETRRFIASNYKIEKILDFGDLPVFESALTYVSIYSLSKETPNDFLYKRLYTLEDAQIGNYENYIEISIKSICETKWTLVSKIELDLLEKLSRFNKLGEIGNAWAGLFTGLDDLLMFNLAEMNDSGIEKELFLPVIRADDPVRNGFSVPSKYVLYPYKEENEKTVVYKEDELKLLYPKGYSYLLSNKEKLQSRKDSRKTFKERKDWYALTRFGTKKIFRQNKIVSPGEVKEHKFSIDKSGSGFSCARVFAITVDDSLPLFGVLAILNSSLLKFFLQRKSSLKAGGYYSYSSKVLNDAPIPKSINSVIVSKSSSLISLNSDYTKLSQNFELFLQSKFNFDKLNKKLQNWHELEFKQFLTELNKAKVKPTLSEEADWMLYFNEQKQKAQELKSEIDRIDREINMMVYELYGLTEEEIKIVEGS